MKKLISLILISVMLILSLSLSFAYADDNSQSIEHNGFVLSAKINYNSGKTNIESIDLKLENKTGEDLDLLLPSPRTPGYNWRYDLEFYNEDKQMSYMCETGNQETVAENVLVSAGETFNDTVFPNSEEFTSRNSKKLSDLLSAGCKLRIRTAFFENEPASIEPVSMGREWQLILSFDIPPLNGGDTTTVAPTTSNPTPTPTKPTSQPTNNNPTPTNAQPTTNNKSVPNPPTDVEGIAVALITAITACGVLLITSKKK